jgi:peptide deformylase
MGLFSKQPKMEVKTYGNPVLRKECEEVKEVTPEIRTLVDEMVECMYEENGIGLAAPQIGKNIRLFVIDTRAEDEENYSTPGEALLSPKMPMAVINPEIVSTSGVDCPFLEGCLSIPGVNATVIRPEIIRLKGMGVDGQTFDVECGGLLARCAQHEIDHLNGVLFVDIAVKEEVEIEKIKLDKLREFNKKKLRKKRKA